MRDLGVAAIEGLMAQMSKERKASATNLTLGGFIDALEAVADKALPLTLANGYGVHGLTSYRGYYEDLALEPDPVPKTVADVLAQARGALGQIYEGYKGGDFPMHRNTLMWVAGWGNCGDKLIGVTLEARRVIVETASDD